MRLLFDPCGTNTLDIRSCTYVSYTLPFPPLYLTIRFSMLKSDIRSCKHITMLTHPPILHITSQGLACLSSNYWILGLVHMFLIPYPFPHPFFIIRARHAIRLVKVLDIRSCKQVSFPQPSFSPPAKYLKICFSMLKSDIRSCKHIIMLT